MPVTAPSTAPTTSDKLSNEAAYIALAEIKKKLLPWVTERIKAGESIEPRAFLPKETRIFELLMRSITKEQYDVLMTKGIGIAEDEQLAIANLARVMNLVPVVNPTAKTEEKSNDGDSGLTPSNSTDRK